MSLQMKSEDRPKAIALVVAIIGVFAFIAFRFAGVVRPVAAPPPGFNASLDMPSTSTIASGQVVASNTQPKPTGENLHEVFPGSGGFTPTGSPFRTPVPVPKGSGGPPPGPRPGGISVPTARSPERNIEIGGGFGPAQPGGIGGNIGSTGGPQVDVGSFRVKGIIAPQNGGEPLAFIQVGERGKGFRIGDEIAPGMKIVGITSTKVSVKIGGSVANFGVGQEVRPG